MWESGGIGCSAEQDEDDRVAAQEPGWKRRLKMDGKEGTINEDLGDPPVHGLHIHLANETILVHTLALAALGLLGPHLLHVLQNHVAVSVKGLDTGQELAVVSAGDQDLGVRAGGGLQEGQRAGGELVLLDESDLIFSTVECKISFSPLLYVRLAHA